MAGPALVERARRSVQEIPHHLQNGVNLRIQSVQKGFQERHERNERLKVYHEHVDTVLEESGATVWLNGKKEELESQGIRAQVRKGKVGQDKILIYDPQRLPYSYGRDCDMVKKVRVMVGFNDKIDVMFSTGSGWGFLDCAYISSPEKFEKDPVEMTATEQLGKAYELAVHESVYLNKEFTFF